MKRVISIIICLVLYSVTRAQNAGIGTTVPSDKLHISAGISENPLRVQVNAVTKLRVHANGGTAIGAGLTIPPDNGLLVAGSIQPQSGIETPNKLVIESTGDSIILNAGSSQVIIAANGNIIIRSIGSNITIEADPGTLNLRGSNVNIDAIGGLTLNGNNVSITGNQVTQNGMAQININSPGSIRFNNGVRGVARINDNTAGSQSNQTIVSASGKVFVD